MNIIPISSRLYLIIILTLLIATILGDMLITDNLYYQSYSGQMSQEMIMKILDIRHRYDWVAYIISPLLVTVKMFFIAGLLYTGSIFLDLKIKFKNFWHIVLVSEFVTIAYIFLRLALLYYHNFQTLEEIQGFMPFSVYSVTDKDSIPQYLSPLFSSLNLFELLYWVVLSMMLKPLLKASFAKSVGFVAKTYGMGLVLWITFLTFLMVQLGLS